MQKFSQHLLDRFLLRVRSPEKTRQVAALPYAVVDGKVAFLLVTSRRSGRWIFPKGSVIEGKTAWESAQQEAFEEAGIEGEIDHKPIGTYRTIKKGGIARKVVEVDLYPLHVTRQHDTWLEQPNRHRHWVLLREAKRLLHDPMLADLATELSRRVLFPNATPPAAPQPVTARSTT
ncbi:MAG: NUDIX hydrolase [Hyphomicrobiaceae bacterium]|nr:NUDIX hydrolase [Hyphomicrobiaceae bacterium]